MTEKTTSQREHKTEEDKDIRPPVIHETRGGGKTFMWSGIAAEYYGIMRLFGYIAGVVSDIIIDKQKLKKEDDIKQLRETMRLDKKSEAEIDKAVDQKRGEKLKWDKNRVARYETGFFAFLTCIFAMRDWRDMKRAFSGALGAEVGQSPTSVNSGHLWGSDNPIIQTATKRFAYMQVARLGTDATFLHSLNAGLIGMAARITIERTLFSQKTAYDLIEKLYHDSHIYNFNLHAPHKIAHEFANITQAIQRDHERMAWPKETIEHYMPFYEAMAKGTVEKKIGMNEAVYLLGELMTKRLTLDDSLKLVDDVVTHSLDGLRKRPKEVIVVNQTKEIAEKAIQLQDVGGKQIEDKAEAAKEARFADKFMSQKPLYKLPLEQGQRSFAQMAEQTAELAARGV